MSYVVGINGAIVMAGGIGDADLGQPATADTRYWIGSITKQLTAAAVLSAVERRLPVTGAKDALRLETAVPQLLDGLDHWTQSNGSPVTVQNLLTMTSNLPNFTRRPPVTADPWGAIPAPALMAEVRKLKPVGWPATFEYSNTSYFVLAEVLERLHDGAGPIGYKAAMQRSVFRRAGMIHSGFIDEPTAEFPVSRPHYRRRPAFTKPAWLRGSGDIVSSATDLHRWHAALMGDRILSAQMRQSMFSDWAHVTPQVWYGMGWFIDRRDTLDVFSHSGTVPGYTSFTLIARDTRGGDWASISILTNSDGVDGLETVADDLLRLAAQD
jgi:CubicO group peptidase (beta-lactamase class C family)